jgi:RES domain-containing protein
VYVVQLSFLGELFEPVVELYPPSDSSRGDFLSDLLQENWEIFSDRIMDKDLARDLIEAIMESGVDPKDLIIDYRGLFHSNNPYHSTLEEDWEERADSSLGFDLDESEGSKLEHEDEGFPRLDQVQFAVEDRGTTYPADSVLYRARIYTVRGRAERFGIEEMGAPPPDKTLAQRANQAGEPVLYMASDIDTALAEVRAWKGAPASVAKMRITEGLGILDLREPYLVDSPFFHENLRWRLEAHGLLNRFAEELSRPVMPHEADVLYRPTQHLCDVIRTGGFDGIAYPSAMGPGYNVVLFNPHAGTPEEVTHHRVERVTFTSRALGPYEPPHEDLPWTR